MAKNEERLPEVEEASAPKKAKKKASLRSRVAKWFREMKSELKKVIWPSKKQVINNTVVSLVVMVVAAIVIWAFDSLASAGVQALIAIFG